MVPAVLPKEARAWRAVSLGLVAAKLAVHLSVLGRWDYHRDEFYFVMCARRLAAGYVDHPPMIAWLTALFGAPFGYDLRALRVVPALAGAVAMALTCLLVRALGGGARAALLAGACVLVGPVFLRTGSLLCIPVLEPALWSGAALVVVNTEENRAHLYALHLRSFSVHQARDDRAGMIQALESAFAVDGERHPEMLFNLGLMYANAAQPDPRAREFLGRFLKRVCRGAAAAKYVDQCETAQHFFLKLPP